VLQNAGDSRRRCFSWPKRIKKRRLKTNWSDGPNLGKQFAAIKCLDWSQEIEFAEALASRLPVLEKVGDTFQAYHTLLALHSMANQLAYDYKEKIVGLLKAYTPGNKGDTSREYVKTRILEILS